MFGFITACGHIFTRDTLEEIKECKDRVLLDGKQCSLVQSKSTLEALLKQLNEGR